MLQHDFFESTLFAGEYGWFVQKPFTCKSQAIEQKTGNLLLDVALWRDIFNIVC